MLLGWVINIMGLYDPLIPPQHSGWMHPAGMQLVVLVHVASYTHIQMYIHIYCVYIHIQTYIRTYVYVCRHVHM